MDAKRIKELRLIAQELRITGLKMVQSARSGHIGGAFSLSEIMAVLYFEKMNIRPEQPQWEDRDRFVLSKGHATVALYPTLATRGFFPLKDLDTFRKIEGSLSGHAEMNHVSGVDMSTGSLGQGFSAAVGMALAAKQQKKAYTTYAVLGDGEIQEGQIWEACMFAAARGLDNLVAILDCNKVQLDGTVPQVLDTGDLTAKFSSFGFEVIPVDGHDVEALGNAFDKAKATKGKPVIIIANTIKGKGVSFMEGLSAWHGKTPDDGQFAKAFEELAVARKVLEG
ncbi:MAG: transketolase [Treponema sp.]|jgi:transketolase|nr:transketolase [Treponema sp.]